MSSADVFLSQILAGPMGNCLYVLGDPASREAYLVDPAWDPLGVVKRTEAEGFRVVGVLCTHTHQDHVGGEIFGQWIPGLRELGKERTLPTWVHELEAARLHELTGTPESQVRRLRDGDRLTLGSLAIDVLHTPGHSPGSVCFLTDRHLISGDTLFVQACGRVDLPGSSPDDMFHSLKRLAGLPGETAVYPGHNYGPTPTSTIANELQQNLYMRVPTLEKWRFLMGGM